jgi:hydrogenase nickel incorporation protein HypA/HybF
MHEIGVASGILDLVREHVPATQGPRVRAIRVQVGAMSGVVADSLAFAFGAIAAGTAYAQAFLTIERTPARASCTSCGRTFDLATPRFVCPACDGRSIAMLSGRELRVLSVDVDEDEQ